MACPYPRGFRESGLIVKQIATGFGVSEASLHDAHGEDPTFGYRYLADEARRAGGG